MRMVCPEITGLKKITKRLIVSTGIIIGLVVFFDSCKKDPDNLGRDLLPSSDSIHVRIDSSTVLTSYSINGKRVLSSSNEFYVLGSLKDSVFGYSSASILTQFHPTYLISADSVRTIDSLILYLAPNDTLDKTYNYYYGDRNSEMTLRVFELDQKMTLDTNYFSDINADEYYNSSVEIANTTFTSSDTLIRIKITDPDFIQKFQTLPDSVYKDRADFAEVFYGLYLRVDQSADKGGCTYLNMANSDTRLTFYYFDGDTTVPYLMTFSNTLAAKANVFSHDYSGFPVAANLNLPEAGDSLMFVEGLAGVSGRISFPHLDEWRTKGNISVNKAELILPVDSIFYPSLTANDYPPQLTLFTVTDADVYGYVYDDLIDQTTGNTRFDGTYDKLLNAYVFNIGMHLQSYIRGDGDQYDPLNTDLVIVSRKSNSTANRVILKGATALKSPFKLKVTYTELF
jgi:hypothetical protein